VIDSLLPPRTDNRNEGYDFGVVATDNESDRNRSVLLSGEYGAVRYGGETYRIDVDDPEFVTVKTYRYTATEVASSPAAYASQLREQHEAIEKNEYRGTWLVRYDGDVYVAELSDEGFNGY